MFTTFRHIMQAQLLRIRSAMAARRFRRITADLLRNRKNPSFANSLILYFEVQAAVTVQLRLMSDMIQAQQEHDLAVMSKLKAA